MSHFLDRARAAWGDVPDWVISLANACERTSQNQAGRDIGYSGATVSGVLANTYKGDIKRIEQLVRGKFMRETVDCPGICGEITKDACLDWQEKARNFSPHNSKRVLMARACKRCARFQAEGSE